MMERVLSWALGLTLAVLLLIVAFLQMSGPTPNPIFGMIAARAGARIDHAGKSDDFDQNHKITAPRLKQRDV